MTLTDQQLRELALELASLAGVVANVCDHAEHNEPMDMREVRESGQRLRAMALAAASAAERDPIALYGERLGAIELRNVLHHADAFDGPSAISRARTWRDLQLAQIEHDRWYHIDVIGMPKAEQLRHYALHLAKLAAAAADVAQTGTGHDDFVVRRVADMLLFGIKLSTVTGERLTERSLGASAAEVSPPYAFSA